MKKIILTLTLAVACMFTYTCNKSNHSIQSTSSVFGMENLPFSEFTIDANSDTVLTGKSGTKLKINKNTFLDSKGNLVHGPVNIELKEAINKVDIVLGYMTTLSNGKILESGGMIYVNAKSGDENLSIASNSSIEVGVPTENKKDSMQIYSAEFDSATQQLNWINPQNLIIKVEKEEKFSLLKQGDTLSDTIKFDSQQLAQNILPEPLPPPIKPQKSSGGDTILSLVFDTTQFPEMALYRNVKFKLIDTKNFRTADSKQVWMTMDLKKTDEQGIYIISFGGFMNSVEIQKSYRVTPIFEAGSDYNTAMATYEKKYEEFENRKVEIENERIALAEKEKQRNEELQKKQEEDFKKQLAEQEKANAEFLESFKNSRTNPHITDPNLTYVFNLNKLGWANVDRCFSNPKTKEVELITTIENKNEFQNINISLVLDKENIYIPGYEKKDKSYGFTHGDYEKTSLPVGEQATIIATCKKDGKVYSSIQRITIQQKQTVTLHLDETTKDKLEQEVRRTI